MSFKAIPDLFTVLCYPHSPIVGAFDLIALMFGTFTLCLKKDGSMFAYSCNAQPAAMFGKAFSTSITDFNTNFGPNMS